MTRPVTTPGRLVAQRYRLQSQIGGGGMGTVWLARDELLGRQVAVKQVITPGGADPQQVDEQRQRALREGRIAARLSHPHAISVYDVALENDQPWLVMEYLPSRSLAEVLRDDGELRTDVVAQIGAQVADALAATHAAGIVHRDVKPANILIGQGDRIDGLVKITDFGISHASGDVTLTQTGQITGTPAFLAPEVAQGREMTEASDVFSLGATLYTCLEGQPPFGMEDNALAMLHRVAGGNIRPPVRAASLAGPLLRMLAADPADRPTMTEVRDELAKLAAGRDGDTTTVLLARTDLGSGGAARNRTSAFPPPPPATATPPQPLPAPVEPPRTRTTPPAAAADQPAAAVEPAPAAVGRDDRVAPAAGARPGARPGARRGRALWIAVAALALLLTGLGVFWAVSGGDPDSSTTSAEGSSSAPSSSASTSSAEATTEPTTGSSDAPSSSAATTEPTTQTPSEPPADPLSAENITDFLDEYHQLVLSDPRAAYARTGPTLRANISEANYIAYWQQFSDVRVTGIEAADGRNTATGTLEWTYTDGRTESGRRVFTVLEQDGQLILDSDFAA
jgi:serine/threonine protein kinase